MSDAVDAGTGVCVINTGGASDALVGGTAAIKSGTAGAHIASADAHTVGTQTHTLGAASGGCAEWVTTTEEENQDLWEAEWDDEDVSGDFQAKLQGELDKAMKE